MQALLPAAVREGKSDRSQPGVAMRLILFSGNF
jgi:hypothetical protein